MMELTSHSLLDMARLIERGEATSVEATRACLSRIRSVDGRLGAFLRVDEAGALESAKASDARRRAGAPLSVLDGVPVALKDMILTEGLVTTAASKMLSGFVPPYDAHVTSRLRAAGMPIIGKCNLDEFAMGSSTENSAFQLTRNPYDVGRTPGGSSGGSAVAVAAREIFASLGTDTGGSIRQPAALTNVVGLKPTWGRVSRSGVIAFASSLDQVGPLTRTVEDCAAMLQVIAGRDENDSTSSQEPVPDFRAGIEAGVRGLRIGLPKEYFVQGMDCEVEAAVAEASRVLERLGASVIPISLPHTQYALAAYYVIAPSEASSNLARYDGVRFGHRSKEATTLLSLYQKSRSEGFGTEVKRRIMLGTFALSAGYHDAYYVKAQQVRTLIRADFDRAFEQVDVVLSATSPIPAWPVGEKVDDPLKMYLMDVLTLPCNLAGLPGISVPGGFSRSGLPLGIQLLGRPFDEKTLLRVAHAFERETRFHECAPAC